MSAINPPTLAALLANDTEMAIEPTDARNMRLLRHRLLIPIAVVSALLLTWMAFAPLAGAVVAPAQIKVDLNRKTVQHQEGGIVRELLVRDGQEVRAGEPLVVIGDLRGEAELNLLQDQVREERVRMARAGAEAGLAEHFGVPQEEQSATAASDYAVRESALFTARRRTLNEQIEALESQSREAQAQAIALQSQIEAGEESEKLAADEFAMNEKLVRSGYVPTARILQLKRAMTDYRSKTAESRGQLAVARQRAADLRERIAQTRNQYRQQAADELKQSTAKLHELEERLQPSIDQVERQIVRSPVDGEVMEMRVSGAGEVIAPREPLLDVVPAQARLVVEARIRPEDINHVQKNASAQVRLTSFDARTTPLLSGNVTFVSGDRITSADGRESYFTATVEIDAANLKGHPEIRLQPGMPAELYVATGTRSLFQYLLRPVTSFALRAMREP
jgi:HlyD family type I secretion membrane fusion protein